MPKEPKKPQPRTVDVVDPSYQPTRAELREDLRLKGTFEDAIKALVRPVKVRYVTPKKRKLGDLGLPGASRTGTRIVITKPSLG